MFLAIGIFIIALFTFSYSLKMEPRGFVLRNAVILSGSILSLIGSKSTFEIHIVFLLGVGLTFIGFWILTLHYFYKSNSKGSRKNFVLFMVVLVAFTIYARITGWPGTGQAMLLGVIPCSYLIFLVFRRKISRTEILSPLILFGSLNFLNFIFILYLRYTR